ncbi:GIY-YIG nuclease family protein [archaeon]|jgi:excinuclease UvrABC nuclease subunit|nr:GIY-YIG nuclease family protein [archaeon]MBT4351987.1 GIY-YIG nuclease family protein [archaeon]MBT4647734.1 GIY-YIG nuclease family protein [archaeon]MBT6821262.1 GIY-YIG nuclease family protein [archaeon]MBT7392061.1 GIY-YIG nuclease family protein [archaeon]
MKYNPPKNPGVYLIKDKDESIIYVGKAKNIKKRNALNPCTIRYFNNNLQNI